MLVLSSCTAEPVASPPKPKLTGWPAPSAEPSRSAASRAAQVAMPEAAGRRRLAAVPAEPASCVQPGPEADQMRAVPSTSPSWRTLWVDERDQRFWDLDVAADGAVWVRSTWGPDEEETGVRRWHRGAWRTFDREPIEYGSQDEAVALSATSARQAWVFGGTTLIGEELRLFLGTLHDDRWRDVVFTDEEKFELDPETMDARGAWAVVGPTTLLRWTGKTWRREELSSPISILRGEGDTVWGLGESGAMRRQSDGWRQVRLPELGGPALDSLPEPWMTGLAVLGPDDVWAIANVGWGVDSEEHEGEPVRARPVALHGNGSRWRCVWGPMHRTFGQAEPDGRGGLWVVAETRSKPSELWHLSDGRWTKEGLPAPQGRYAHPEQLVKRPGKAEVYVSGYVSEAEDPNASFDQRDRGALWRTK
ncbi:hypothetical protein [Nonomuraea rosea]|uniref:hypothetical protein n=1 Tax=Nonomuraea rosea TaxID=638574 RepID=UPI0031E6675C